MLTFAVLLTAIVQGSPCGASVPAAPALDQARSASAMADVVALSKLSDGTAAPATLKLPTLSNASAISKYMREHYPDAFRMDSTTHDMAMFWACVDSTGAVVSPAMLGGTGAAPLDTFALQLVSMAHFNPATVDGKAVAVWVPYPVQVSPLGIVGAAKPTSKELSKQPVFTPYDVKPQLTNARDIAQEMVQSYPPRLKSAGTSGVTEMWVFVDEKGSVKNALVKQTSGNRELDDFALGLTSLMRFTPATRNNVPVAVWTILPLRLRGQ